MTKLRGSSAFETPAYHLAAYSLRNPVVAWCIETGIYNDPRCLNCMGSGKSGIEIDTPEGSYPMPCRECRGTGFKRGPAVHQADVGDDESAALAKRLGTRIRQHRLAFCPAAADWRHRCICVLR